MLRNFSLIVLCLAYIQIASANAVHEDKIDADLRRSLNEKGHCDILISMRRGTKEVLDAKRNENFATRTERIEAIRTALIKHAKEQQVEVWEALDKLSKDKPIEYTSFWISNQVYLKKADEAIVNQLARMGQVSRISEEQIETIDDIEIKAINDGEAISTSHGSHGRYHGYYGYGGYCHNFEDTTKIQWGIEKIDAPSIWKTGNQGEGIIVGIIDSGARGSHEALQYSFLGEFGWYDPIDKTSEPTDDSGHGSHVTGTIAGTKRYIGVAPKAKWIHCKACTIDGCRGSHLLKCGEYILCPTDTQGEKNDCSKAPHVVNNSWGSDTRVGQARKWYNSVLNAWRDAGIIPVFSNGNAGSKCGTVGSPGDQNMVIGVGNTQKDDTVAPSSARGPTDDGRIKPDVSAPGTDIISAYHTSNCVYATLTGTSMAAPHVTGAIAILLSENSNLEYDDVLEALTSSAEPVKPTGQNCGDALDFQVPNNNVGAGRINLVKALKFVKALPR